MVLWWNSVQWRRVRWYLSRSINTQSIFTSNQAIQRISSTNQAIIQRVTSTNQAIQRIPSTNQTILYRISSTNQAILYRISSTNQTILYRISSTNQTILYRISSTNQTILYRISSTNQTILQRIASTNQTILQRISSTNQAILYRISSTNQAILWRISTTNRIFSQHFLKFPTMRNLVSRMLVHHTRGNWMKKESFKLQRWLLKRFRDGRASETWSRLHTEEVDWVQKAPSMYFNNKSAAILRGINEESIARKFVPNHSPASVPTLDAQIPQEIWKNERVVSYESSDLPSDNKIKPKDTKYHSTVNSKQVPESISQFWDFNQGSVVRPQNRYVKTWDLKGGGANQNSNIRVTNDVINKQATYAEESNEKKLISNERENEREIRLNINYPQLPGIKTPIQHETEFSYDSNSGKWIPKMAKQVQKLCTEDCTNNPSGLYSHPTYSNWFVQCGPGFIDDVGCQCCQPFYHPLSRNNKLRSRYESLQMNCISETDEEAIDEWI